MAEKKENATLMQKIVAIQHDLVALKGRKNEFGGFMFRSCEDILKSLKPLLWEHQLALFLKDKVEMVGDRYYMYSVVTVTDGVDSVEAYGWAREPEHKTKSDDAQVTGMASSYARKYALCGLFIIDNTDNKDFDMLDNSKDDADDDVARQIKSAQSIEQLTAIWKGIPGVASNAAYKEMFSQRKHELQDER